MAAASVALDVTETMIFSTLRAVLLTFGMVNAAGAAIPIIRGQVNRVPEPGAPDFAIMWPILRARLATNIDTVTDGIFVGSITGSVLTVTSITQGIVMPGQPLLGSTVVSGTVIGAQASGTAGGVGVYAVSPAQTVASGTLYCGTRGILQPFEQTIQVDLHGPSSADNAHRLCTLMRDQFAVDAFDMQTVDIAPLYTSDPRQLAFENGEQQTEERWSIDVYLQVNPVLTVSIQFAGELTSNIISVEAAYP